MRNWIKLFETTLWWERPHGTIEQLEQMIDEIAVQPGADPDFDQISEYFGYPDCDEHELIREYCRELFLRWRKLQAAGDITVYRMISVPDVDKFIKSLGKPRKALGCFWTHDIESASCDYHPEANFDHDILLIAKAPPSSVEWGSTLTANLGHPHENELTMFGPVHSLQIQHEGRIVFEANPEQQFPT